MPALGNLPGAPPEQQIRAIEKHRVDRDTDGRALAEADVRSAGVWLDESDETAESGEAIRAPDPARRFRR